MQSSRANRRAATLTRPEKRCGCTGVRWCARCLSQEIRAAYKMDPPCELPAELASAATGVPARHAVFDPEAQCAPRCADFEGVWVVPDALSRVEAAELLCEIESSPFKPAQSGKLKQHAGARVNFNKRRISLRNFVGLPAYARRLEARLRARFEAALRAAAEAPAPSSPSPSAVARARRALDRFETTDVFVLRYRAEERSNLDLHVDDTFAYGEAIFDLSLESDSTLTFHRERPGTDTSREANEPTCVRVPMPARSAVLVTGVARFDWEHGVLDRDIAAQRTSVTLRTLSAALRATPEGERLLARARGVG